MPRDTKTALLDCAEHAARARGYDGFSYADLAKAVGIRKASIHYHFPSKSDLSRALMARYTTQMRRAFAEIEDTADTGGRRLKALVDHYRAALNNGETLCLCVAFTTSQESLPQDVVEQVNAFRNMMVTWIASIFDLGAEDGSIAAVAQAQMEARSTLALLEGAHLASRAAQDARVFDKATELLRDRCR